MVSTVQFDDYGLTNIINGCISGDRASQARLYYLYADSMMNVCMWYSRNREEAEEALQDGFIRVFTYVHTYKGEGSFEGWVRKIMINAALAKCRRKLWRVAEAENLPGVVNEVVTVPDFITNYDEKKLLLLIQKLPPSYRAVFNLHIFEGYSHAEIAKTLGISKGTSKSNLADARRILQKYLGSKQEL